MKDVVGGEKTEKGQKLQARASQGLKFCYSSVGENEINICKITIEI